MLEEREIKMPSCNYYQLLEVRFSMCWNFSYLNLSVNSELRPKIKCTCLIVLQRTLFSDWPEDICRIYVFIHLSGFLYLFSLCLLYFFHWSNGARASSLQLHHQAISRFLHQQKVKVIYVPGIAHTLITSLNILHLIKLHQFYSYQSL